MTDSVATVEGLVVAPATGGVPVVDGVGFAVARGEVLGIAGESGSGKSTTALTLFGYLRPGLVRVAGEVRVGGIDPFTTGGARRVRGHRATHLGQDPASALNPARRLGTHLAEAVRSRGAAGSRPVRAVVGELLERVSLPADRAFLRRFPHQVSGGQARRVALAAALAGDPDLLVLDEPTAGLDPVVAADVRAMLAGALRGRAAVLVSHDARLLDELADRVLTLRSGRPVEWSAGQSPPAAGRFRAAGGGGGTRSGAAGTRRAGHDTAARGESAGHGPPGTGGLVVEDLVAAHGVATVVDGVSLTVPRGGCLALVGPSGSGKTTVARCVAGLHRPRSGRVLLGGRELAGSAVARDPASRRAVALVAQDSVAALNPAETVAAALARPLRLRGVGQAAVDEEIDRLLDRVRLPSAAAGRRPGRLSGGERQRVNLARALAAGPEVLICDEITSALDGETAAVVTDLVDELRRDSGLTVLTVTHDAEVVRRCAEQAVLIDGGRVRARGDVDEVLSALDPDAARPSVRAL